VREHSNGVPEPGIFQLLHERNDVAACPAAEAFEKTTVGMHVKRRRFLGVKWAETNEVVSALAQRHVLSNEVPDVNASSDLAKRVLVVSHCK
jgi:hypothetical protein